jgi:hypothetical protein
MSSFGAYPFWRPYVPIGNQNAEKPLVLKGGRDGVEIFGLMALPAKTSLFTAGHLP